MPNPLTLGMHEINLGCADCMLVLDFNCSRGYISYTIDSEAVRIAVKETRLIVTVEEYTIHGGLGSAVAEVLAEEKNQRAPLLPFAIADDIHKMIGNQNLLLKKSGLSMHDLVEAIYEKIGRHV